jgi:hypothetical protein
VFPQGTRRFSFLDQIQGKRERSAFMQLYQERQPSKKLRLAEDFLRT